MATFIAISYPNLQQDPLAIQSILVQISQQLANSTTNGGSADTLGPSNQLSFVPPSSVVFINAVWFLSLTLTLTCALIATLMQQWARRYLQMVQRTHAPYVGAHIREYFVQGANKFGIHALVEVLPFLLLISVMFFFAGLVVFAFRANHVVAYITLAIVAFCSLSYITLTLLPFVFPNCPYQTPLTTLIWYFGQVILLLLSYIVHHCAKGLHKLEKLQGKVTKKTVDSLQHWHETNVKSISEGIVSKFENSARPTSMDIYRNALRWTLNLLDEDRELEEFVSGIPGLRESEALAPYDNDNDPQHTIRAVLAVLPGPTSFRESFPWSIIPLAQRAITSDLSEPIRRQRIKACLKALYYIPGAIRDLLAPYAAKKYYCLEILPLLNSIESLEIIEELRNTPRDDVALSVWCAAAVVSSFMITPPRGTLETFLPPKTPFIGNIRAGKQFLSRRLAGARVDLSPGTDLHSDDARLQNLGRFLKDLTTTIGYMDRSLWERDMAQSICDERLVLFEARKLENYLNGKDIYEQDGNRKSPAFIPAAQQDLVTLTLHILTRDSLADAGPLQYQAFDGAYQELLQAARASQTRSQTPGQSLEQILTQSLALSLSPSWGTSLPQPPSQVLGLILPHLQAQSRLSLLAQSLDQVLEQPQVRALANFLTQSLGQSVSMRLLLEAFQSISEHLPHDFSWLRPLSLPQFLAQSLPQLILQIQAPSAPPSANIQVVDDVEMATRAPQQVAEDVDIRPQTEDQPTVHDGPLPSTSVIPWTASAGPSRPSSSVASSSSSLLAEANPGNRGLSDSARALV